MEQRYEMRDVSGKYLGASTEIRRRLTVGRGARYFADARCIGISER